MPRANLSQHGGEPTESDQHFVCWLVLIYTLLEQVYDNSTGEPICVERATYGGNGTDASQRDNAAALDRQSMNEPGFVAVPPCVWGESSDYNGELRPPPGLGGERLRIVKRCNATFGHHGEMAHGQIFYAMH